MKRVLGSLVTILLLFALSAMAESTPVLVPEKTSIYIEATADGPVVTQVIVELPFEVQTVFVSDISLSLANVRSEVTDVFLCDEAGQPAQNASRWVAFTVATAEDNPGDFDADFGGSFGASFGASAGLSVPVGEVFTTNELMHSVWVDSYRVRLHTDDFTTDDATYSLSIDEDCICNRICPDAELFNFRSVYTGTYVNPDSGEEEEQTLQLAAYEPESLAGGEQNPVIIWLHGQTEGGTDPEIAILGNEVSALAGETIQSYFTAGNQVGAYVLVPQCATYWMDEGKGVNGAGGGVSRYTEILMDAILEYLAHNPDADPDRLYIGGSSNGGYMTLNMLICYPGTFAAAYPLCELYGYYQFARYADNNYMTKNAFNAEDVETLAAGFADAIIDWTGVWMTEDKIAILKDTPIWFVSSVDDTTSAPVFYLLPTYRALLQAGAENCHLSLFETKGHTIWKQFFQNEVTGVQDPARLAEGTIPHASIAFLGHYDIEPTDEGGGTLPANGYTNIFAWMNAQSK